MRLTYTILSFILLVFNVQFKAQKADCNNMVVLKDTIYHTGAISGFGAKKEFSGNALDDAKVFQNEDNSIWYFIFADQDAVLTFDIITENKNDDWDFILYKYTKGFCKKVANNVVACERVSSIL